MNDFQWSVGAVRLRILYFGDRVVAEAQAQATLAVDRELLHERCMAQIEKIGPLPSAALDVIPMLDAEDCDNLKIANKISHDPYIMSRVFKIANSTFYSRGVPADTIAQAISRLGIKTLKNVVLAACVGQQVAKPLQCYPYSGLGLWEHSFSAALLSKRVATFLRLGKDMQEELYLAALMHDIGKVVTDTVLADSLQNVGLAGIELEKLALGFDHGVIGESIAELWKLPEYVSEVIVHHHNPANAVVYRQHTAAMNVLDWIMARHGVGLDDGTQVDEAVDGRACEILGLNETDIAALEAEIVVALPETLESVASVIK